MLYRKISLRFTLNENLESRAFHEEICNGHLKKFEDHLGFSPNLTKLSDIYRLFPERLPITRTWLRKLGYNTISTFMSVCPPVWLCLKLAAILAVILQIITNKRCLVCVLKWKICIRSHPRNPWVGPPMRWGKATICKMHH